LQGLFAVTTNEEPPMPPTPAADPAAAPSSAPPIQGTFDPAFAAVRDAFAANFENDLEVGACFSAAVAGKTVVDLWGGFRDQRRTRPWESDTIVCVWSTTKVMTALCAWMLAARGALDLDAPVARYWPQFAAAGKDELPVRFLLSHSSGLAGWEEPIDMSDLYDWERSTSLLAAQAPWWEPGTASGYHAVTFGHLIGEVVHRITGRSLGRFFRDEVAAPLRADFHIGLAAEHEDRLGDMVSPTEAPGEMTDLLEKVMTNPRGWSPGVSRDRAYRAAEVPGANGHGNARSVARVAAALASGGALAGVRLLPEQFFDAVLEQQIYGQDLVLGLPIRWGLGVGLPSKEMPLPNPRSFYWGGWGGSLCLIDLDAGVACAYVMNKMSNTTMGDRRGLDLVAAVYGAL
jgi:CubicO group peptidase (beta-lactamase class C family)